jgi:Protein of unknown function (DUF3617)
MMKMSVAAVAALILVGCGSQDKGGNNAAAAKAEPGAAGNAAGTEAGAPGAAASGARAMQPGQWEMVTQVTAVDMPGAPPEAQAQLRAQQGRAQTDRRCITPAQAANPTRDLVGSGPQSRNCQFSDRTFGGGVIRIRATCRPPGGGVSRAELAMEGAFTETTLDARLTVSAVGPNMSGGRGTQTVRASSTVRGRRIGECPAGGAPPVVRTIPAPPPALPPRP